MQRSSLFPFFFVVAFTMMKRGCCWLFSCFILTRLIDNVNALLVSKVQIGEAVVTTKIKTPSRNSTVTSLHRVSLPILSDTSPRIIRQLWKWKDLVLGDGRDYFIPRPRAIRALTDMLVGKTVHNTQLFSGVLHQVVECGILSNCARLDVILVTRSTSFGLEINQYREYLDEIKISDGNFVRYVVATTLLSQLEAFQKKRSTQSSALINIVDGVSSFLDLSGMVVEDIHMENHSLDGEICNTTMQQTVFIESDPISQLLSHLNHSSNSQDIVRYFCHVAAGISNRPSRIDRPAIFRPYSSRDAHIMLQLKRTTDICSSYSFTRIKILLDSALQAGKAARNPSIVPSIVALRSFDSTRTFPPPQITTKILQDVYQQAIEPTIDKCMQRWQGLDASVYITELRHQVDEILQSLLQQMHGQRNGQQLHNLEKRIQGILHTYYIKLRENEDASTTVNEAVAAVQEEVQLWCNETNKTRL